MRILLTGAAGLVGRAAAPVPRPDASGIDAAKAQRMLGWQAIRGWRDYLTESGEPR